MEKIRARLVTALSRPGILVYTCVMALSRPGIPVYTCVMVLSRPGIPVYTCVMALSRPGIPVSFWSGVVTRRLLYALIPFIINVSKTNHHVNSCIKDYPSKVRQ